MGNVPGRLGIFSEDLRAGAQRAACLVRDALAVPKSRRLPCCFPQVWVVRPGKLAMGSGQQLITSFPPGETLASEGILPYSHVDAASAPAPSNRELTLYFNSVFSQTL